MPWIEDRGQTDRVTTPTRAGLHRWPHRVSWQLLQPPAVVAVIIGYGVIMHRCRHGKAPQYLVDCCTPVTDVVGRQRLRSATQQLMVVLRHRLTTVGRRAFAVHGPVVWNSLPDDLRAQQDYEFFRQGLKTWLLIIIIIIINRFV